MIASFAHLKPELAARIEKATGERVCFPWENGDSVSDAEIAITLGSLDEQELKRCDGLKWLFVMSAGVEKLPFELLRRRGVTVTNVSGMHATQMAEQAMGMMILFSRCLLLSLSYQRRKIWQPDIPLGELRGRTLLIVGAGSVGQELARKAKAFDMRVVGLKRRPAPLAHFDRVFGMEDFRRQLGFADYVAVFTPLTEKTFRLFGGEEFSAMKKDAVFINFSRGDVVDESALIEALKNGGIRGAGLDVFHREPLEAESPLWEMPNVVVTPHDSGHIPDYSERAVGMFLDAYRCYRSGAPLPNLVDLKEKY